MEREDVRDPLTGRTPAEEQLVVWNYYLDVAMVMAERDMAREALLIHGYDTKRHLQSLKDALGWPEPSDYAIGLAMRALTKPPT